MKNWEKKELVRDLRKQSLSYKELRQIAPFKIAKSTVSDWCKDIELTEIQKDRLQTLLKEGNYRGRLQRVLVECNRPARFAIWQELC
ncbi:MAG: hypothetical protein NTW18_05025 [Candidatus Omnitrophica bacterium]|nr:hypothetical protein [Candidatus Omnitrophota bacterium]